MTQTTEDKGMGAARAAIDREDLFQAFVRWSKERRREWNPTQRQLAKEACDEMLTPTQLGFEEWWVRSHIRYQRGMRELERAPVRMAVLQFVVEVSAGKVQV